MASCSFYDPSSEHFGILGFQAECQCCNHFEVVFLDDVSVSAAVNTPNKSAIWLCVSHTPLAIGRIVTRPFSIVMGCVVIISFVY